MSMVAEWLVFALPASAERNSRPAVEVELVPLLIEQLKVPFHFDAPIALHYDFRRHRISEYPRSWFP